MRQVRTTFSLVPSRRWMVSGTSMPGFSAPSMPPTSKLSWPVRFSVLRVMPSLNCSGSTPMPTRFERWMRSKVSHITAFTPSRLTPLAAQSRDEPVPYSLPAIRISGVCSFL